MSDMEGNEGIPLGNGMYIDTSSPVVSHWKVAEDSAVADVCFEKCSPEDRVENVAHCAIMNAMMNGALTGEGQKEVITDVRIRCKGPRGLFRNKCGAELSYTFSIVTVEPDE